jgi:homoserine O-acetyltransferase
MTKTYHYKKPFHLDAGGHFPEIEIAYNTWGELNKAGDNVIWICHALTANSDVQEWWPEMLSERHFINPKKHFIVCANILSSCYGSTSPMSINPETGKKYYRDFPMVTMRDLAKQHDLLREHLGIKKIYLMLGGSVGGMQAMEYGIMFPDNVENLMLSATSATQTAWACAFDESQRMAIETDPTFNDGTDEGGLDGMKVARSIALLSYRNNETYNDTQPNDDETIIGQRACSYQRYQGEKLAKRYDAYSYYQMTLLADSHNVGRGRGSVEEGLSRIKARTLCVGVSTDILYPTGDQKFLAKHIPNATYDEIGSPFGHDGFLIEVQKISAVLEKHLEK